MIKTAVGKVKSDIMTVQRGGKTVCPAARFQQMVSGKYKLRILWGLQNGWGPVVGLVGIEGGVVSGVTNLESPGVRAPIRRPRHEEGYHDA